MPAANVSNIKHIKFETESVLETESNVRLLNKINEQRLTVTK